ncbi:MAG: hypothetical protein ACUZ8A_09525 [Candidatus Bathyanammoxibius sp.]
MWIDLGSVGFVQLWLKGYHGETFAEGGNSGALWALAWIDQDIKYELTGKR